MEVCPAKETMAYALEQEGYKTKSLPLWAIGDGIHAHLLPNVKTTLSLIHDSTPLRCREVFEFTPTCGESVTLAGRKVSSNAELELLAA